MINCFDLKRKFDAAALAASAANRLLDENGATLRPSVPNLCRVVGIDYAVQKSKWAQNLLIPSYAQKLATFLAFDPSDTRFCDPMSTSADMGLAPALYGGTDNLEAFKALLRETLRLATPTTKLQTVDQRMPHRSLVAFDLEGGQAVVEGNSHEAYLSLRFGIGAYYEVEYGISRARLRIIPEHRSNARYEAVLGRVGPFDLEGLMIVDSGLGTSPEWDLNGRDHALSGRFACDARPLFKLIDACRGYTLRAEIAVQPARTGLVFPQGPQPPVVVQAIIRAIIAETLPDVTNADGWVTLGWQQMTVTDGRDGAVVLDRDL